MGFTPLCHFHSRFLILIEELLRVEIPQVTAKFHRLLTRGEVLLGHSPVFIGAIPAVMANVLIGPNMMDRDGGEHL